jgi:hypothetical protein
MAASILSLYAVYDWQPQPMLGTWRLRREVATCARHKEKNMATADL